jgi:MFS family permease
VKRGDLRDLRTIVHDSTLLALSFSSLLISAVGAIILFMMLPFLEEFYGLSLAEAGGLSMLVGAVAAAGFVFSGFMIGKWTGLRKRLILAFLLADSVFLVSAPFILIQSLWVLIVALAVEGFVLGVLFPAFLVLTADYCPEEEVGTELGAFQGITSAGYVVGYFLAGILWDVGSVMGGASGGLLFCMLASVPLAFIPIPLIIYKTRETKTQ